MVEQVQSDVVAMKCVLPVLAAESAMASGVDPAEWIREVHGHAASLVATHVAGDGAGAHALRERALASLDMILTAVQITKLD